MTKKAKLSDLLHKTRDHQLAFDGYLTKEERDEVGTADSWSAKDNIVHSAYWADRRLQSVEAFERGDEQPQWEFEHFEDQNQANFLRHRDLSWDEVKAMVEQTYDGMAAYLKRAGEETLEKTIDGLPYPIWRDITEGYVVHPSIHLWTYLEKHGYSELGSEILGEQFLTDMLALDDSEAWRGVNYYNMACNLALAGDSEAAIKYLADALQLQPNLTDWSKQDSDLDSLRDNPAFQALYNQR